MQFDRFIKKIKQKFLSPTEDMMQIHRELEDAKNIMKENIDYLLEREKTIEEIGSMAQSLRSESESFASNSK